MRELKPQRIPNRPLKTIKKTHVIRKTNLTDSFGILRTHSRDPYLPTSMMEWDGADGMSDPHETSELLSRMR